MSKSSTEAESTGPQHFQISYPSALPITEQKDRIVAAIRANPVIIVAGETGSGKTTQLPKMCLEAGLGLKGQIGCTQPRRIAALTVSRRIAEELGVTWGNEVGCKIRFSDQTKKSSVIKVMTDGILLAETRSDPQLRAYKAIIIDEAHERSLNIDFLIGYLKQLITQRPDLKLIITSATIDTELFSRAFNNAPIFEVSGRLYPVEIRYQSCVDEDQGASQEQRGSPSYVDAATAAVEQVIRDSGSGDVLVFMPSERDIREAREWLTGRLGSAVEVSPLMGSLSAGEQEKVFRTSSRRKVIIATNIAETSLTIPNIRYVIDTGLARISRYSPRSRTKRLPIERIAQSSANQRAGRAGRVRDGICIRLYTQTDFDQRPTFTDPEILRANLAEVVLRMKAFGLGEIEQFPFLNPPDPRAIRSGYAVLQALGALDSENSLTSLGKELARLPVDPTVGRMLLQSKKEAAIPEMLVITAGLSIQDPRERPLEKREKAQEMHRKFEHPDSDFLTLLHMWNCFQLEARGAKNQGPLRLFCKRHFLSYMRMREWSDVHAELSEALGSKNNKECGDALSIQRFDGRYRAIHRSVLSGLLGQVAYRVDKNRYRAAAGRELLVAPGSSLRERQERGGVKQEPRKRRTRRDPSKEQWVVAAEIIETSHLFARNAARIIPNWIEELAGHLIKRAVEDPHWSIDKRCVMANERITLQGLELAYRQFPYSRVDPEGARDLFVRTLLVPEDSPLSYPFVEYNRKLCDKIATQLAHAGRLSRMELEERLIAFYSERLPPIASLRELEDFVRVHLATTPDLLTATPESLSASADIGGSNPLFPDELDVGGAKVQVHYRYNPGSERDGVTLSVPLALAKHLPSRMLDGAIPALREQQVLYLIRGLPKEYRLRIDNYGEAARVVSSDQDFDSRPLIEGFCFVLRKRFGVDVPAEVLSLSELPAHLRPRIEVSEGKKIIASGRDLAQVQGQLAGAAPERTSLAAWQNLRAEWERSEVPTWDFGDLPEALEVTRVSSVPVHVYPALVLEEGSVALRLLETKEQAVAQSHKGVDELLKRALAKEVQDLAKQSKAVEQCKLLITLYSTTDALRQSVMEAAFHRLFDRERRYPLTQRDFEAAIAAARGRMSQLIPSIVGWAKTCLELRRELLSVTRPYPGMREELGELLPPNFSAVTPFEQLQHLPRYLKAMLIRAERAENNPAREQQRVQQLAPYVAMLRSGKGRLPEGFRWMVEEFKVSLFAQELGTAYPISATRLDKACAGARR